MLRHIKDNISNLSLSILFGPAFANFSPIGTSSRAFSTKWAGEVRKARGKTVADAAGSTALAGLMIDDKGQECQQ